MFITPRERTRMLDWARPRYEQAREVARQAQNTMRAAQRDYDSIHAGDPSSACVARYYKHRGTAKKEIEQ